MYRALVPIDADEDRVRSQIETVRDLPNAAETVRVDLLYVYEQVDTPADEAGSAYVNRINENIEDLRELPDTASLAVETLEEAGIETDVHDVAGDPSDAILELAEEFGADAIVVGARRRSPVGKVVFGSVAQSVILDADRPVMVAPA